MAGESSTLKSNSTFTGSNINNHPLTDIVNVLIIGGADPIAVDKKEPEAFKIMNRNIHCWAAERTCSLVHHFIRTPPHREKSLENRDAMRYFSYRIIVRSNILSGQILTGIDFIFRRILQNLLSSYDDTFLRCET